MSSTPRVLTLTEAADQLGVAPARVRALLASGALQPVPGHHSSVAAADVEQLAKRGVIRALDVAAVEGALDRALRRRLPELLGAGLGAALEPLQGEFATALADVELSTQRATEAEQRAQVAEQRAEVAEQALAAARERVSTLEARVAALEAQPMGLFRRRRSAVAPA